MEDKIIIITYISEAIYTIRVDAELYKNEKYMQKAIDRFIRDIEDEYSCLLNVSDYFIIDSNKTTYISTNRIKTIEILDYKDWITQQRPSIEETNN